MGQSVPQFRRMLAEIPNIPNTTIRKSDREYGQALPPLEPSVLLLPFATSRLRVGKKGAVFDLRPATFNVRCSEFDVRRSAVSARPPYRMKDHIGRKAGGVKNSHWSPVVCHGVRAQVLVASGYHAARVWPPSRLRNSRSHARSRSGSRSSVGAEPGNGHAHSSDNKGA